MGLRIDNVNPALDAARARIASERPESPPVAPAPARQAATAAAAPDATNPARAEARVAEAELYRLETGANVAAAARDGIQQQQASVERLQALATQASDGLLLNASRQTLNRQALQEVARVSELAATTEFQGARLLDGTGGAVQLDTQGAPPVVLPTTTPDALGLGQSDLSTPIAAVETAAAATRAAEVLADADGSLATSQARLSEAATALRETDANTRGNQPLREPQAAREAVDASMEAIRNALETAAPAQSNVAPAMASALLTE